MGDALAVALMECRGFTSSDFAKYHPGGALGKKLYVTIGDLIEESEKPEVAPSTPIKDVIISISRGRVGAVAVMDKTILKGIITDGDIRRMLERGSNLLKTKASDIMGVNPKTIESSELAVAGFQIMESNSITQLIVVKNGKYKGIVHLHDILKEGIF
jgi:arabinose-5-phosphate isomerase